MSRAWWLTRSCPPRLYVSAVAAAPLHNHLEQHGVEFLQFAFRWMNCLLMREISLKNTIRMWDTYMV